MTWDAFWTIGLVIGSILLWLIVAGVAVVGILKLFDWCMDTLDEIRIKRWARDRGERMEDGGAE